MQNCSWNGRNDVKKLSIENECFGYLLTLMKINTIQHYWEMRRTVLECHLSARSRHFMRNFLGRGDGNSKSRRLAKYSKTFCSSRSNGTR